MTVVSSLQAADLDPARLKARGALMLRDFLAYAASQASALPAPPDGGEGPQPTLGATGRREQAPTRCGQTSCAGCARRGSSCTSPSAPPSPSTSPSRTPPPRPGGAGRRDRRARLRRDAQHPRPRPAACRAARQARVEHVRVWTTDIFRDPARDVARVVAAAHRASEKPGPRAPAPSPDSASTDQSPSRAHRSRARRGDTEDRRGPAEGTAEGAAERTAAETLAEPAGATRATRRASDGSCVAGRRWIPSRPAMTPTPAGASSRTPRLTTVAAGAAPPHWGTD